MTSKLGHDVTSGQMEPSDWLKVGQMGSLPVCQWVMTYLVAVV
jgi:hypothetical protein